jgi:hypothetical protein
MTADPDWKQWFGGYAIQGGKKKKYLIIRKASCISTTQAVHTVLQDTWKGTTEVKQYGIQLPSELRHEH